MIEIISSIFDLFLDGTVNVEEAGQMLDRELETTGGTDIILAMWKRKTIH